MIKTLTYTAMLALAALAAPAMADELDLRDTSNLVDTSAPQRGMTMQRVESSWGQPQTRRAAVGEPPITRWEYDGFIVYFEHDRVIHTVMQRS